MVRALLRRWARWRRRRWQPGRPRPQSRPSNITPAIPMPPTGVGDVADARRRGILYLLIRAEADGEHQDLPVNEREPDSVGSEVRGGRCRRPIAAQRPGRGFPRKDRERPPAARIPSAVAPGRRKTCWLEASDPAGIAGVPKRKTSPAPPAMKAPPPQGPAPACLQVGRTNPSLTTAARRSRRMNRPTPARREDEQRQLTEDEVGGVQRR